LGGAEEQVVLLSKALVRLGHEVGIYSLSKKTARMGELAGAEVDVVIDAKRERIDLGVLWRLRQHLRRWCPDIVHGFQGDGNIYSRLAGWGARVPVLNSERSDDYHASLVQRIGYRLASMLCDGIVANTYGGAEFARRLHRVREDRVDVLWNSIDLHEVDARIARSEQPARQIFPGAHLKRLCMVVSIKPQNDYPLALRVLRRLVDQDSSWRLICVGDEPAIFHGYKARVLAERDRLGLDPFVKFVGHRRDVVELIASSDLLLLTSVHGGFPVVALEAMAGNTVVVSTDYGDVRRLLPVAQQVVGSRGESDVAESVLHCYRRRAEIAKLQRHWVDQHASASASAAALLGVYSKYALQRAVLRSA
jgi:glycosyltransferase involved in cell wall biosynthesis